MSIYQSISRKVWQPLWAYHLGPYSFGDNDGNQCQYNNDTFECQAYDWDFDSNQEYNFWHKPSGYKIKWYKYAMRSAEANMDITAEQFVDILNDCVNSINNDKGIKVTYAIDKWWENNK